MAHYELIGSHIESFCKGKWKTLTHAANVLGISNSGLSKYIHERQPSAKFQQMLLSWGFPEELFNNYWNLQHIQPEQLSKTELFKLIQDQRLHIESMKSLMNDIVTYNNTLYLENRDLRKRLSM